MASRTVAGALGLNSDWDLGDAWKAGMDANLLKLSVLSMPIVLSRTTSLPGSPTEGQVYIIPTGDTDAEDIAVYDEAGWHNFTPAEGWMAYVADEDAFVRFDGTVWDIYSTPMRYKVETGTTYSLVEQDLDGRTCLIFTNAGAVTFTIPSGLTGLQPVVCISEGAGGVTNTASGTTLNSKNGLVADQGAQWAIIPRGSDVYRLTGELTTP